jgi:hypothetical protein
MQRSGAVIPNTQSPAASIAENGEPPLGEDLQRRKAPVIERRFTGHHNRGRTVAVFFDDDDFFAEPFDDPDYAAAYAELGRTVTAKGGTFFIVRHMDTYLGGNAFSRGWLWTGYGFREMQGRIIPDVIYNKGLTFQPTADAHVITTLAFDKLCSDKSRISELLTEYFPLTITATDRASLERALAAMPGKLAVVKPVDGWGGRDVFIGPKGELAAKATAFPVIVQEFIDTSGGIPGVLEGPHDFRIMVADGEVIFTYAKIPAEGSLVSNIGLGGHVHVVPPAQRPLDAMLFVDRIDPLLAPYGRRFYSIDCGRDISGAWKLIEINSHPGLPTLPECGQHAERYFSDMADFLLREITESRTDAVDSAATDVSMAS